MKRFRITYTWKDWAIVVDPTTFEETIVVYAESKTDAMMRFKSLFRFKKIKRIIELH